MKTKVCSGCGYALSLDHFYPNSRAKYGVASRCKPCANLSGKKWKEANPEKVREINRRANKKSHRKTKYGLTPEDFSEMLIKCASACTICRIPFQTPTDAHVDHDHVTGKIRNLLCRKCNLALGLLGDDLELLIRAALYLIQNGGI